MLGKCGFKNAISDPKSRYGEITDDEISKLDLDYIFLSSEPYPFKQKHIEALQKITKAKVILVDGEMFSWYGSRLMGFKSYYENELVKLL